MVGVAGLEPAASWSRNRRSDGAASSGTWGKIGKQKVLEVLIHLDFLRFNYTTPARKTQVKQEGKFSAQMAFVRFLSVTP